MRPLVVHNAAAEVLFYVSVSLLLAVEVAVRVRSRAQGQTSPEWSFFFVWIILGTSVGAAYAMVHLQVAPFPGSAWWPLAVGLTLMWMGILFRAWAVFTLGAYFKLMVVVQSDHKVIDHGPYRWLRHPSYLGALIALVGFGVVGGSWASTLVMLIGALTAFVVRIRVEERVLLGALGEEYAAYARRTARLIPGLY